MTLLITEQETRDLISMEQAISVADELFHMIGGRTTDNAEPIELDADDGYLLLRAAAMHSKKYVGFKVISTFGSGPRHMWNHLYSIETGELLAIVQSRPISLLRAAAVNAVAAMYLSPSTANVLGVYGTGKQADTQVEGLCKVRPIHTVYAYSRDCENRRAFCDRMSKRLEMEVIPTELPQSIPKEAHILLTVTNSETPVLKGDWLEAPALVLAAGANEWNEREIDEQVVARAGLIAVDDLDVARRHCGDLLWAAARGTFRWSQAIEFGEIVAGRVSVPDFSSTTILFESQGIALEDLAITAATYELAVARGLGSKLVF